jgi:hypothetical protein
MINAVPANAIHMYMYMSRFFRFSPILLRVCSDGVDSARAVCTVDAVLISVIVLPVMPITNSRIPIQVNTFITFFICLANVEHERWRVSDIVHCDWLCH